MKSNKYVLELESKKFRIFSSNEDIAYYYELDKKEVEQSIKAEEGEGVLFHINGGFLKVYDKFPTEGFTSKAMYIYRASNNQLLEIIPINEYTLLYISGEYTQLRDSNSLKRLSNTIDVNNTSLQSVVLGGNLYNIFIKPEHSFKGVMVDF